MGCMEKVKEGSRVQWNKCQEISRVCVSGCEREDVRIRGWHEQWLAVRVGRS